MNPYEKLFKEVIQISKETIIITNYKRIVEWKNNTFETTSFIISGKNLVIKEMDKQYIMLKGFFYSVAIKGEENEL